MKLKDIVYASLNEDYSTANNIFGSVLASKIEKKLEIRKRELIESLTKDIGKEWQKGNSFAKANMVGLGLSAALGVIGLGVSIPGALQGMKQARRFGKIGPNLKYIQRWFPKAKPGDEILLAFESSSGSLPSHQYIKYEQIAVILAALDSDKIQHNEKQLIVNGIDQSQESFGQITAIAVKALEREQQFDKLASYQQTQYEQVVNEQGKGTNWNSWAQNANTLVRSGESATKSVSSAISDLNRIRSDRETAEARDKEKEVSSWEEILTDGGGGYSKKSFTYKQKKETAKKLETYIRSEGKRDYAAQNLYKMWTGNLLPYWKHIDSVKEFAKNNTEQLYQVRGQQRTTVGYLNKQAGKVFAAWLDDDKFVSNKSAIAERQGEFVDYIKSKNLADLARLLFIVKGELGGNFNSEDSERAMILNARKEEVSPVKKGEY